MDSAFLWWIFCAIIGGAIGAIKGRVGAGILWGGLLGPIGILIVCCLSSQESINKKTTKKCPFCAERIQKTATICKHCGKGFDRFVARDPYQVEIVQKRAVPNPEANIDDFKVCPACAEEIRKDAKICRFCMHSFIPERIPRAAGKHGRYFYQLIGCIQQGPVGSDVISSMIRDGRLGPDDQVLIPGQGWHKVSEIKLCS